MVFLPELILGWGWMALILAGFVVLTNLPSTARRKRRIGVAVVLFGLALAWQQVTQQLNFGVTYGRIRARWQK